MKLLAYAVFAFLPICVRAEVVYLENSRLKIGVDLARGGMMVYLEDKLSNNASIGNLINGVGSQITFRGKGYTAVQDGKQASSHAVSADRRSLDVAVENCRNANAGAEMAANYYLRYEIHDGYLAVRYSFIDLTGGTNSVSDHEIPALYTISKLTEFSCYTGASGWSGGALSTWSKPPFWGGNGSAYKAVGSDECWCAWTDAESGRGVGLYTPGVGTLLMGRLNPETVTADPSAEARSYAAPLMHNAVPSGQMVSGVYYLAVGEVEDMRRIFAAIHFGMVDGAGMGKGSVRMSSAAGGLSVDGLDMRSGSCVFRGRFFALNEGRTSDDFALVCRTNLVDAESEFLLPVKMTLGEAGENASALVEGLEEIGGGEVKSLFITGIEERPSPFRAQMLEKGFDATYADRLAALHELHPKWKFEPLMVGDMTWNAVIDHEMLPAENLVVHSTWAAGEWLALGLANYTPYYAENAQAYDSGSFYQASRQAVEYFMDPRNFLNGVEIFMFETLEYDAASQTEEAVNKALSGSFMRNANYDGGSRSYAALLVEMGAQQGVSPVFLAGRLKQEQGEGTVQAMGRIGDSLWELYDDADGKVGSSNVWGSNYTKDNAATAAVMARGKAAYNGYYNFFNMGAAGTGLFEIRYNAWKEAYEAPAAQYGPWTTQERAIRGGAVKMKNRYIDTHRHTRYLQKFSVLAEAGSYRWLQYMQNIASPLTEARSTRDAYVASGAYEDERVFLIPVYIGMPADACPDPANGNSVYSPSK